MNSKVVFTTNNFDLLRLFAAFQVVIHHSMTHLGIKYEIGSPFSILGIIPGVPIFFFISGYLISKSYENNSRIKEFAQNRILRIYPALLVCVLLSVLSVYLSGYYGNINVPALDFFIWLFGQLSFYQFYNPEFMRGYGTGVINGSLWTITVELQFYIVVPFLYLLLRSNNRIKTNKIIIMLVVLFLLLNRLYYLFHHDYENNMYYKLLGVSFIPWYYMFLVGVFVQRNFEVFYRVLSKRFLLVFVVFSLYLWSMKIFYPINTGNDISPLVFLPMVAVLFSAAYTRIQLSKYLLNKNDISYGLYIYHMPVVNAVLYFGFKGEYVYLVIVISVTLLLSFLSWKLVEYPSLMFKRHPLNPLYKK